MANNKSDHITSCTILWSDWELKVVTKVLQTEIQVRHYADNDLLGGRIWPMSEQQKQDLYKVLYDCLVDLDSDDYSVEQNSTCWQFKICTQRKCLRTVHGTKEPPPHGKEIKKLLIQIIGEDNCYFF